MAKRGKYITDRYAEADQFIRKQVAPYQLKWTEEDCLAEGWVALPEAKEDYAGHEGCCSFLNFAALCIHQNFEMLRTQRNARISPESNYSLNKTPGDFLPLTQSPQIHGDFSNSVALRNYIERQNPDMQYILRGLCRQDAPEEIITEGRISPWEYHCLIADIQKSFQAWMDI